LGAGPQAQLSPLVSADEPDDRPWLVRFCSREIELERLGVAWRYAFALLVHVAEIELRFRIVACGGPLEPLGRFHDIPGHPFAAIVNVAHVVLRGRVPRLRGSARPTETFDVVLRHADSVMVTDGDRFLRRVVVPCPTRATPSHR